MIYLNKMWKNWGINNKYKRTIKEMSYNDININEYIIIDVRSRREFKESNINGSINIPLPEIKNNIERYVKDKNKKLLICCQYGIRSAKCVQILENMGYTNVYNLKNGIENI